jgi:hypothetical protein
VLVAAALLAAPTPEAVAQAPSRQPRELWRQYPLETRRSTPRAAGRESTSGVSVQIPGGAPGEGTDRSVGPVLTAATVSAMALLLLVMTGGLAYAARGQFEFGALGRRRRLAPSFPELLASPPGAAPPHADMERPERKQPDGKRIVRDPYRRRPRDRRGAVASIISEVDALRGKLDSDADRTKTESLPQDRIGRLRERLNTYFAFANNAGTANGEVENLKAKLDVHGASAKSEGVPPDERERLKEKLGMQPAYTQSASHDELQTLKEKLSVQTAAPKGVSTTDKELEKLKAKLAKEAALASARETTDSVAQKEKLSGAGAAPKRETKVRASLQTQLVDHGARRTSGRKVEEPAAPTTPVAPPPVSPPARRSTIFELVHEHGSNVAMVGVGLIALALLLLNIAVFFGIGVEPY